MGKILGIVALLILSQEASANAGIPMLAIAWPAYWIALLPVILFEGFLAKNILNTGWKTSYKVTAIANIVSTFVGIPIMWVLLVFIEILASLGASKIGLEGFIFNLFMFVIMSPWLYTLSNAWHLYAAFVILAIPFCIVSILVENAIGRKILKEIDRDKVYHWARTSNIYSYFAIIVFSILYPLIYQHSI